MDNLARLLCTINLSKDAVCLLILSHHHEITWSLWYKADEEGEQTGWHTLTSKHVSPARLDGPLRIHHVGDGTRSIIDRIGMRAHDDEVDKVNHQLTEDDGKLVPAYQHTADVARSHLADIHRTDGRSHTHTDTAEHAIEVEHHQERPVRLSLRQDVRFRFHRSPRREEEADTRKDERSLSTKPAGEETRK